jgi:hypothetical protein
MMPSRSSFRGLGLDSPWVSFDCSGSKRWRYLEDGSVEIEGEGPVTGSWPSDVNQWREPILRHAGSLGIAPAWLAAIMAIESTGRPGFCLKLADGSCSSGEGIGLMAIKASTASGVAGRKVTWEELLNDHDLNIQLGAKYLKLCLDQQHNDPVRASVQYNAGSVRCGAGTVFGPSTERCPTSDWNVVEGCTLQARPVPGLPCAPSTEKPGKYACSIDRPRGFIKALNAAVASGWEVGPVEPGPPPEPLPGGKEPERGAITVGAVLALLAGVAAGFGAVYAARYAAEVATSKGTFLAPRRRATRA